MFRQALSPEDPELVGRDPKTWPQSARAELVRRLTEKLRDVESQVAQLQADSVRLVGEIDALEATDTMSTSAWIGWQAGLSTGEARRKVALARRLPAVPVLADAFTAGAISEGTAAVLASVATPANQQALVDAAEVATGAQLQRLVADYRPLQPKPPPVGVAPDGEFYSGGFDDHGMYGARFRMRPEWGHAVEAAMRSIRDTDESPTPAAVAADHGAESDVARLTSVEALARLAQDHLAGLTTAPTVLPQRFWGIVRVDESILHPEADDDPGEACLHAATSLDPHVARRMLCDAAIAGLVTEKGRAVSATAPQRFVQPWQVTALVERDRGCRWPGCRRTTHLVAHHVERHPTGPTRLDNLVLLCEHHHQRIHQRGWHARLAQRSDGSVHLEITRADGTVVRGPPAPSRPPPPPPPVTERYTGTGEPLTFWARDVLIGDWMAHDERALRDAAGRSTAPTIWPPPRDDADLDHRVPAATAGLEDTWAGTWRTRPYGAA
jgi:hypothetical protein